MYYYIMEEKLSMKLMNHDSNTFLVVNACSYIYVAV